MGKATIRVAATLAALVIIVVPTATEVAKSRAIRRYIGGPGRDGKQDWRTRVVRDDRATGPRDHKRDRGLARASLESGEDGLPNGKRRRYSERYGAYEL